MATTTDIRFFTDPEKWGFLSNFHEGEPLQIDGVIWPTVEHYYQAMKFDPDAVVDIYRENNCLLESIQDGIRDSPKPIKAKRIAEKNASIPCPEKWHSGDFPLKDQFMAKALRTKFAPRTDLAFKLLSTGTASIIEDNPWDSYWGIGEDGCGRNRMGELLMEIRSELAREGN